MWKKSRLILALDVDTKKEAEKLVMQLKDLVSFFKVGMRLFFHYGPEIISSIKKMGGKVFLDSKLHDIPTVVEATAKIIGKMDVDMLTIHTLGGKEMMRRAKEAIKRENPSTKVLGVTVLTSIDQRVLKDDLGIEGDIKEKVLFLAQKAEEAGLDGVVCSGKEVETLREYLDKKFLLVVPGIRPYSVRKDEQKRTFTPKEAILKGADYLVIGRPILQASDPVKATKDILREIDD
ncbi:orotidine-5'-phosphate decarboxylase [Candidatus Aerophobetes bacterium]|nr:orotidine-5'-phosphate decarboxylase [Candidatus Aerophobetes bacterium]